ncbi:MAG TPA: hypothetical protein VGE98_13910 [Thermoanaerobaculia bacterium]
MRPSRRSALIAAVLGFVLHSAATLWAWRSWGAFGRGNVIAWMDFPLSLLYLHLDGKALLASSLAVGGLQWSAIAAGLSLLLGRSVRPDES